NQMRTLIEVPVSQGGVAGSFQQVGQRLGNAIGIAIGSAIFYAMVAAVPRDTTGLPDPTDPASVAAYAGAFQLAMAVLIVFSLTALVFASIDHRARKRQLTAQSACTANRRGDRCRGSVIHGSDRSLVCRTHGVL